MSKRELIREGLRKLPVRPVYLVSMEHDGKNNIITIGMFAIFSGTPTLVGIGIKPARFSFDLVRKSGEFVVNVVDKKLMEAVRVCGENSGRDVNKFRKANLTPSKGATTKAPLILESPVNIECKVVQEVETGDHTWFIGEVTAVNFKGDFNWKNGQLFKWIGNDGFFYEIGKQTGKY